MTLTFVGMGLNDARDVTIRGLQAIKLCQVVYLENYTATLNNSVEELEYFFGKKIIVASRDMVESRAEQTILKDAEKFNVGFLVVGDVFSATTHTDLYMRAKKAGIVTDVINNASIMTAIGITGLQLYKFGKTTSMVFFDGSWKPPTAYNTILQNKVMGLHTLVLLDIKVSEPTKEDLLAGRVNPQPPKFMTIKDAVLQLLETEKEKNDKLMTTNMILIGVARLGSDTCVIKAGTPEELILFDFGGPMHSLIVPGTLHFAEEEMLALYR